MKSDLRISLIAIFLFVASTSSVSEDVCSHCVEMEKCDIYKQMTKIEQETWVQRFPCQESQRHPQQSFFGFSITAKGDYVCCSNKIWGIESDYKRIDIPMKKNNIHARYSGFHNNDYNYQNTPHIIQNYNRRSNQNNNNVFRNNPTYYERQVNYEEEQYTHSNLDEQCAVPSSFPPVPKTGCCGLEATDDDRIIVNQNARLQRGYGTSNYWPIWRGKYSNYRERQKRNSEKKANITLDDRIAGGKETEFTDFPWTVLLKSIFNYATGPTAFNCGGSLISSRYVLTAGHCVYDKNGPLTSVEVYLAEYDKRTFPRDCKYIFGMGKKCIENIVMYAEHVTLHADYDDERLYNDISLVRLHENAPFTDYIRPICLPPIDIDSPELYNVRLAVAGWGRNGQYQSDIKQSTVVNLVPQEQCKKFYPDLTRDDLCAAGYRGEDTCKGDSGGPLMTVYGGKYYVVGVVSGKRADSPCGTSVPSLYTNVYRYVDWIRNNIRN